MFVRGNIIITMQWVCVMYLIVIHHCDAINRSVYKIQLTQKGYAQFIQYDVETPPLREFTFCSWINFYGFESDQTIFTYLISNDNRPLRLWIEKGGNNLKLAILDKVLTTIPVHITKSTWHNICMSYQSDFGAWAIYVDERLVACEAAHKVLGYIIPGGGSIIIGYGVGENGISYGLEGEIYGTNMILRSTIERNHTLESNPRFKQEPFQKNKLRTEETNINYVALNELSMKNYTVPKKAVKHNIMPEIQEYNINNIAEPPIKNNTVHSHFRIDQSDSMEIFEDHFINIPRENINSFIDDDDNFKQATDDINTDDLKPTGDKQTLSLVETPPPVTTPPINDNQNSKHKKSGSFVYNGNKASDGSIKKQESSEIYDFEVPPPVGNKDNVYGQWTSSRFAASVLNYLKSNRFQYAPPKVPATIPLQKLSDSYPYPYPMTFKTNKIVTPMKINKVNFDRVHRIAKREIEKRKINVEIVSKKDNIRDSIMKSHAKTFAKNVELITRSEPKSLFTIMPILNETKKSSEKQSSQSQFESKESQLHFKSKETQPHTIKKTPEVLKNKLPASILHKNINANDLDKYISYNEFISNLPFLKSLEYFLEEQDMNSIGTTNTPQKYKDKINSKRLWHNVKSFSNDLTPRDMSAKGLEALNNMHKSDLQHTAPAVQLNFKYNKNYAQYNKPKNERHQLEKARDLAFEVSNQANHNKDSVSLLKYNHGYLPKRKETKIAMIHRESEKELPLQKDFHRPVKIGNALNEQHIVGRSDEEKRKSFIGGNNKIPDINRYRSDIDQSNSHPLPASLVPKVCKNVELYDRVLYVKPDGSIDMTHILSPFKVVNVGVDFVVVNYRKCSLSDNSLQSHSLLLIDYGKTPVRLFGGATPTRTRDLCGFF